MNVLSSSNTRRSVVSLTHLFLRSSSNPNLFSIQSHNYSRRLPSNQSDKPLIEFPPPLSSLSQPLLIPTSNPNPNPNFNQSDFRTISNLLTNPNLPPGPPLETALAQSKIIPNPSLLLEIFTHFGSSLAKSLLALFLWAEKKPNYQFSISVFNSLLKFLAKSGEFDSAWSLIVDRIGTDHAPDMNSFAVLIRLYARAGMFQPAIRTYEYASNLDFIRNSNLNMNMFEILLRSFCTKGHVRVVSEYLDRKRLPDPCWDASTRVYNILLNGWFRVGEVKQAEQLWLQMRKENVKPSVATYGILVEGYCRMHQVEVAIELICEMAQEGISQNAIVYNPLIDALGEAGRFKEALGMMERLLVSESGPDISTYNSLVKGFCRIGDLAGASKILKMMINRGCVPTPTTYNYFFWHFQRFGKIEEGLNLYNKMIQSGHIPDGLTYRLLLKMLFEQESLNLAMKIIKEMRARGCHLDSTTCNRLICLLCKMHRFEEAFREIEDMVQRGVVPWSLTYHEMRAELKKQGLTEMTQKLCDMMMASVPHLMKLPDPSSDVDLSRERRTFIMQKAEAMSEILYTSRNAEELVKHRRPLKNSVSAGKPFANGKKS